MRQISFEDLELSLTMHIRSRSKAAAATATFEKLRRHDTASAVVAGTVVTYLKQMRYRVVAPDLVSNPPLASGHGWGPTPGRWGVDEPEPGLPESDHARQSAPDGE